MKRVIKVFLCRVMGHCIWRLSEAKSGYVVPTCQVCGRSRWEDE